MVVCAALVWRKRRLLNIEKKVAKKKAFLGEASLYFSCLGSIYYRQGTQNTM